MDVHDDMSPFLRLIENQKEVLRKAQKFAGQRPRGWVPRGFAYVLFMKRFVDMGAKRQRAQDRMMHSSFIPPAYPPCTRPLTDLRCTRLRSLKLEVHHRGAFLVLRAITPPIRYTGVLVLVEDEHEDVAVLQLYHQEAETVRAASEVVDADTVLIVKEPYFKIMASGEYGLRVDHLSDIIYLNEHDPRVPKAWLPRIFEIEDCAETLKTKGNLAMRNNKHWDAIRL